MLSSLALSLLLVPPYVAADSITVVESGVSHSFAQQATFTLRATSDAEITKIYLFFRTADDGQAESVEVDFEQTQEGGNEISAHHVQDLRLSPLPPFATVTFWWQIEDAAGQSVTTDMQQFEYTDNRFRWEQLGAGSLIVHWIEEHGDPTFGQTALNIAQTSLEDINAELRAPVPASIVIYVYDSQESLEAAMALTGREWVGGQAHPELGVVLVAIPSREGYTSRMKRDIPHEITHLLVYQSVEPAGYRYVPTWLNEGLATANEQWPTPEYTTAIEEAVEEGQLISLGDLCVPFSPDPQTAFLSYAQSGSVVRFIREQYGAAGIRALLAAYTDGASCASGVQQALNVSLGDLETAWRASLEPEQETPRPTWVEPIGIWVGLWLLSLLVAVPMIGGLRRR